MYWHFFHAVALLGNTGSSCVCGQGRHDVMDCFTDLTLLISLGKKINKYKNTNTNNEGNCCTMETVLCLLQQVGQVVVFIARKSNAAT